jgi:uncharacterized membrane protein
MKKTLMYIWIILIILTIFAYLLGYLKLINSTLVAILFVSTFIKGQLVIDYFMGLREVQTKYRFIPTIWLGVVISLLAVAYYLPIAV